MKDCPYGYCQSISFRELAEEPGKFLCNECHNVFTEEELNEILHRNSGTPGQAPGVRVSRIDYEDWLKELGIFDDYWYAADERELHPLISKPYDQLRESCRNNRRYDPVVQLKFSYEAVLKLPALFAAARIYEKDNYTSEEEVLLTNFASPLYSCRMWYNAADRMKYTAESETVRNLINAAGNLLRENNIEELFEIVSGAREDYPDYDREYRKNFLVKLFALKKFLEEYAPLYNSININAMPAGASDRSPGAVSDAEEEMVIIAEVDDLKIRMNPFLTFFENEIYFTDSIYLREESLTQKGTSPGPDRITARIKKIFRALPIETDYIEELNNMALSHINRMSLIFSHTANEVQRDEYSRQIGMLEAGIEIQEDEGENTETKREELADALTNRGQLQYLLDSDDKAVEDLKRAVDIYENLRSSFSAHVKLKKSNAHYFRGLALNYINRDDEALLEYGRCIEIREELYDSNELDDIELLAEAYKNYASGLSYFYDEDSHQNALKYYKKSILLRNELIAEGEVINLNDQASAYYYYGELQKKNGQYKEAAESYSESCDIREELHERGELYDLNYLAASYLKCGIVLNYTDDNCEALEHYERAIEIYRELAESGGIDYVKDFLDAIFNRARTLHSLGRFMEAVENYTEVIYMQEELIDKGSDAADYRDVAESYVNRGLSFDALGQYEEALSDFEMSTGIFDELYTGYLLIDLNDAAMAYFHRAYTLALLERFEEAVKNYDESIELFNEAEFTREEQLANAYYNKGIALNHLEKNEQALEAYEKSIDIRDHLIDIGMPYSMETLALSLMNYANTLVITGREKDAVREIERSIELFETLLEKNIFFDIYNLGQAYFSRGNISLLLNDKENELVMYEKAVYVFEKLKTSGAYFQPEILLKTLYRCGKILQERKELIKALEYVEKGLSLLNGITDTQNDFAAVMGNKMIDLHNSLTSQISN